GDSADILLISSKLVEGTSNADDDVDMYIAQATIKTIPNNSLDVYGIFLRNSSTTQVWNSAMENTSLALSEAETLNTYGVRLKGNVDGVGVDYTVEVAKQTGEAKTTTLTQDKDALAYAVRVNYALPNNANKIKIGFEYAVASGDGTSGDNKNETFSNLYPTNHAHFGIADRHAWRNLNALGFKGSAKVNDQLSVKAAYWNFTLDEKADGAYAAGNWNTNTVSTLGIGNTNDAVGSEVDLVANYKLNKATGLQVGWSRYFVGDAITDNNATAEDSDFAYLQLVAKF
ncbi:MAG: alginate export family protein, partial [Proteobacteria bacterium]|nr:alginate export family protein [Pseudomonadota bacterium]